MRVHAGIACLMEFAYSQVDLQGDQDDHKSRRVVHSRLVFLSLITGSVAQQQFNPLEALQKLSLPSQSGAVPVYYSACCKGRAIEVQSTLADCVNFYKEKLGIDQTLVAAVLDENDWNRVVEERPNHKGPPYGMTHWAGPPYVAFTPADDGGIITRGLLADKDHETTQTRALLSSAHLSFDEAARKFIIHPTLLEVGHRLIHSYGIEAPDDANAAWMIEFLSTYFAYSYEKSRRPDIAVIVEAVTKMSSRPMKYTAVEDFPKSSRDASNFTWYHHQFESRVVDVYAKQGLDFLIKVKESFPAGSKDLTDAEALSRLERISPGFQKWASRLATKQTKQN